MAKDVEGPSIPDEYYEERWAVALVVRSGGAETNKRIATAALRKGWHFRAYGRGFTTPDGEVICRSEREVFEEVGLPYLPPEER
jgi:DNA polymerase/3'-5' exonuclease PolX